ncbi:DNA-binding SARP family transcriptional activator [Actinoplanes lutulentus]|uniref:DNA-binding SARP family transcriptional activator n=1 Tax=Actinoplanes lutulentus TaxID=1287878 RepID=A0A327ZK29_9ACTN|nr:AfsR/SARP family transcriptional regulator [Actinoplanes lutulentus]MBB2940702.1 DNA-binding SARP family transcriptional activator [Actinoplanes lutulentus]RAK43013.1 DNA-binding SARP family transcriptional activator [Actinoplanes lutulentus]
MLRHNVRFTVLGPVRAWRDDREIDLGTPQSRTLLALLLAHGGQVVSLARIVDALWGAEPPRTAINAIHRNVGLLRRQIEPGLALRETGSWLIRSAGGYRIDAGPDSLDLLEFRHLVQQARDAAYGSAELFREALRLWEGACAEGIDPQARGDAVFTRLDQELFAVTREAADVALAHGDAGILVSAVERATERAPFDEPLHARLIRLLTATGQTAQALAVHQRLRTRLADDLGLSPGREVAAAHNAVFHPATSARATGLFTDLPLFAARSHHVRPRVDGLLDLIRDAVTTRVLAGTPAGSAEENTTLRAAMQDVLDVLAEAVVAPYPHPADSPRRIRKPISR